MSGAKCLSPTVRDELIRIAGRGQCFFDRPRSICGYMNMDGGVDQKHAPTWWFAAGYGRAGSARSLSWAAQNGLPLVAGARGRG